MNCPQISNKNCGVKLEETFLNILEPTDLHISANFTNHTFKFSEMKHEVKGDTPKTDSCYYVVHA